MVIRCCPVFSGMACDCIVQKQIYCANPVFSLNITLNLKNIPDIPGVLNLNIGHHETVYVNYHRLSTAGVLLQHRQLRQPNSGNYGCNNKRNNKSGSLTNCR